MRTRPMKKEERESLLGFIDSLLEREVDNALNEMNRQIAQEGAATHQGRGKKAFEEYAAAKLRVEKWQEFKEYEIKSEKEDD